MMPDIVIGSVTGTGAALNVEIGFVPNYVEVYNQTTGRHLFWYSTMPAGYAQVEGTGVTEAQLTTGGISAYNGAPNFGFGFTIGTDAVNTNTNVIAYKAFRSGPGAK